MKNQEKNNIKSSRLQPLIRLLPFLRPYKAVLFFALLALTVAALATLAVPFTARHMIDSGFSTIQAEAIDQYFWALFLVAVVLATATAVRHYLVSWLGERVVADVRLAVYRHVISMSPVFFETTRTGEVLSRLTTDTTLIQSVVGSTMSMALRSMFMFVGGLILLIITSPELTIWIVVLVPLILLPIVVFGRRVRRLSRASQDAVADTSAYAEETLNAVSVIQAFTHEKRASKKYGDAVESAFETAKKRLRARSWLTALVILFVFSGAILLLWLGAQAVINKTMTPGELSQFVLYAFIVASSAGVLSEVWGELQRAAGATERLMELLHIEAVVKSPKHPTLLPVPISGAVTFENIAFYYPSRPQLPAISNFSYEIKAGQTIALVGPSGAGKSTIFHLLLRFYDPQQGQIKLDGVPIHQLKLEDLRHNIALVPQDTVIFSADAMENIRYGRPDASDDDVLEAAHLAHANVFLSQLPQGYQTHLGERGVRLSGGERQRIAIARAVLKDPPILLLDEATSALDAESEREVQLALNALAKGRTTLVIAHRLATVLNADCILVIDKGKIVAAGTHETLIKETGLYKQLAELQFSAHTNSYRVDPVRNPG
ncbi:Efflux ABC transporter, permease/ATP-binding protein [hydrothermal vent metagenome]|uniref:Efflux ABC transporter, permease/ATP-binding protein n=1 Tax=hydrothermal vent metagenome TaxID=652676 RepID=A0A3B0ZT19_9ZZZZ